MRLTLYLEEEVVLHLLLTKYIHLYSPERQQQQVKKSTKHTTKTNKQKREKTTLKSGGLVNSVTTNEL